MTFKISLRTLALLAAIALVLTLSFRGDAVTPGIISYQGRVLVTNAPFSGAGNFRFALVNSAGTTSFWSNDGTSVAGSQPTAAVPLTVTNGLYSVVLGDTTVAGMTLAIPSSAFTNIDVRLRVWFDDGTNGIKQLLPDQRVAAVGYAMVAQTVDDSGITTAKVANGAITEAKVTPFSKARVHNSNPESIPSNISSNTIMTFDTEDYNINNMHSTITNPSRLTCTSSGVYEIIGQGFFDSNSTGERGLIIQLNGSTDIANSNTPAAANPFGSAVIVNTHFFLNSGDYVELYVGQNSGGPLGFNAPTLMMAKLP